MIVSTEDVVGYCLKQSVSLPPVLVYRVVGLVVFERTCTSPLPYSSNYLDRDVSAFIDPLRKESSATLEQLFSNSTQLGWGPGSWVELGS